MATKILVGIKKPNEKYRFTEGDLKKIGGEIIKELGEEDAKKVLNEMCKQLGLKE